MQPDDPVVQRRVDDPVDVLLLADLLAWAPWRTGEHVVTRDQVIKRIVERCRKGNLWIPDKPEAGLKRILGDLSALEWVQAEYGMGTCVLAMPGAASRNHAAHGQVDDLDGLVRLTVEWALPVLVANVTARHQAWAWFNEVREADPAGLTQTWVTSLKNKASTSGFAQSDVTTTAMAFFGSRESAEAFRDDPPLAELRRVAHAHRADFLRNNTRNAVTSQGDREAVDRLLAALRAEIDRPVQIARPRDRVVLSRAADVADEAALWAGSLAGELASLQEHGLASLRAQGDKQHAAEEIVQRTTERMRNTDSLQVLKGSWWTQLRAQRREYYEQAFVLSTSDGSPDRGDRHEWADPLDANDRIEVVTLDAAVMDRSERVRDGALAFLRARRTDGVAWHLATVLLESSVELFRVSPDPADGLVAKTFAKDLLRERMVEFLQPHLDEAAVQHVDVDAVIEKVEEHLKEAFVAGRDLADEDLADNDR